MSQYLDWKVGDKVVCVDASAGPATSGMKWGAGEAPIEGHVYTIARIFMRKDKVTLWLREIRRCDSSVAFHGPDVGYHARRFRPVQTRKTDISQFQAMLHDQRQKVPAA